MPSKGESLSPWEHTAIGALAGFVEVCVMQPTVGVKNALQEGRPVPRNPMALYRGLTVGTAAAIFTWSMRNAAPGCF